MQGLISIINLVVKNVLVAMMFLIVLTVTWQVFSRFILGSPSSYTEELSRFLLIWISMLGAAFAYHTKAHLGLNLFVEKLNDKRKRITNIFIEVMVLVFAVIVLIYAGTSLVMLTLELNQRSAALEVQVGLIYLVLPISGVMISLYCISNLCELITAREAE